MDVIPASKSNIDEIVNVHNSAFPGFFLTELGESFLKLYYDSVLKSKSGILLECSEDGKVIGFCAACTESKGFNTNLIKENFSRFALEGIRLIFTKPKALIRLYNNLSKTSEEFKDNGEYAELMSIGVNNNIQSKGVGQALLHELEEILRSACIKKLSLTTDVSDNEKTLRFYSKSGFKPMYEFISYPSRKMYRLIKDL